MPIFEYKAYAAGGDMQTGVIDADTPRAARQALRRKNILVSDLKEVGSKRKSKQAKAARERKPSIFTKLQSLRTSRSGPKGKDCTRNRRWRCLFSQRTASHL